MDMVSLESEKVVLACFIKHPMTFIDVSDMIDENDFSHATHRTIFQAVLRFVTNAQTFDVNILANYLAGKGLILDNRNNIDEYVKNLAYIQVNPKMVMRYVEELKILTARRTLYETAEEIKEYVKKQASGKQLHEILADVDTLFNEKLKDWNQIDEPVNLFADMMEVIESIGENPLDEVGMPSPYKTFNDYYGGFEEGNVYAFVARPKQGKTTLLTDMAFKMGNLINKDVPILMLDTEMESTDLQTRICSSMSGVPLWYLATGNWRKDLDMMSKVRPALEKSRHYKLQHYYVAGKPTDKIVNIMKRWYYTKVGRGNPCVIIYDYLKLTGEKLSEYNKEYQAIGDKVSKLKDLITTEVKAPLLTACQLNRTGSKEKPVDDATAVAQSDRLLWFASYVGILRRKTLEEKEEEPVSRFGTHKLITLEARKQGRLAMGHDDLVKVTDPNNPESSYHINNFINLEISNFSVTDKGSAKHMHEELARGALPIEDGESEDDVDL